MRRGLIGARLGHSYSAGLHRTLGGYPYELIEVDETQLAAMMKKKDFSALNVTIPYKQTVIPWLDELDERARRIGAVNTITNDHGHLKGWNTDAAGFEMMLKQAGMDVGGRKVIVLGNGGAAQAVIAVLEELGAGQIIRVKQRPSAQTLTYPQAYQLHGDAQVLINTSPVGMAPDYQGCPVDLDRFAQLESVADVIYNPHRTRLLLQAQQRGLRTAGGLIMLVAQAAEAVRLFDGKLVGQDQILSTTADLARSTLNLVLVGMPGCGKSTLRGSWQSSAADQLWIWTKTLWNAPACRSVRFSIAMGKRRFARWKRKFWQKPAAEAGRSSRPAGAWSNRRKTSSAYAKRRRVLCSSGSGSAAGR